MATNPKMLEDWGSASETALGAYLLSNRALRAALPTTPTRHFRGTVTEEGQFMGVPFTWSRSDGADFPAPISAAFERLETFAALAPNWDSYGGKPLKPSAVPTIIALIFEGHSRCAVPEIHPLSGGGVSLAWHRGDRDLEVQVSADGTVDALLEDPATGDLELPRGSSLNDLNPLLNQFFG